MEKCLNALDSFTGKFFSYEVIVVDNNSGDQEIFEFEKKFSDFIFINNPHNGGFGNGCNTGAGKASGDYLLFLNPDTVASEAEVSKLLNSGKNSNAGILSCRQVNENGKESSSYGSFPSINNITGFQRAIFKQRTSVAKALKPELSFPDWVSGSVILISNVVFSMLKGFDEDFWMYFEDVDLCKRMKDHGGQIIFNNKITIEHNHGGSSRINIKTASLTKTEVHISRHLYISKHMTGIEKFSIQSFLIINNVLTTGLTGLVGILFFFIPKLFTRTLVFLRLIHYYFAALFKLSWLSPRSVKFDH